MIDVPRTPSLSWLALWDGSLHHCINLVMLGNNMSHMHFQAICLMHIFGATE